MDDLTLLGTPDDLRKALPVFYELAASIGLSLNPNKCVFLFQQAVEPMVFNGVTMPAVDFRSDALRLLGSFIGYSERVKDLLQSLLDGFERELGLITTFSIPKQLKFAFLRCCYSSKFNHILRSCPPSIALQFCQKFNTLRTRFVAQLIEVEEHFIPSHAFLSYNLGGIGLTKSWILTRSAFLGGLRNFLFEFKLRFPNEKVEDSCAPSLIEGQKIIELLSEQTWAQLFPNNCEPKEKSLKNIVFTYKKLQNKLKVILEGDVFEKKLSEAKSKNTNLYNLLLENSSMNSTPSSSLLLSTIPRKFGLNISDENFVTCLKLRLNLDPGVFLIDSLCLCGKHASFNHVVCCSHFNWSRSILHNAMIDELHNTCKSVGIVSSKEPLLGNLANRTSKWTSKSRGDLHLEWLNSKQLIVDATTVYFNSQTHQKHIKENAEAVLKTAEQQKNKKYTSIFTALNSKRQIKLEFVPIAISLCGRLSTVGEKFFIDFQSLVRSRGRKYFSVHLHKIKFVFSLYNRFCSFLRRISMKLSTIADNIQHTVVGSH
ncbi:hypothetical protein RCL1_003012 [Eukaryota sp. TZLM3-RCL]